MGPAGIGAFIALFGALAIAGSVDLKAAAVGGLVLAVLGVAGFGMKGQAMKALKLLEDMLQVLQASLQLPQ